MPSDHPSPPGATDGSTEEPDPSSSPSFLERFRNRRVVQWIVAYLSVAWLILQVVDVVGEQFAWPTVLERVITVALAAGFLPAAVVAWYHGEKGHQRVTRTEGIVLATVVLFGAGAIVGDSRRRSPR